MFWQKLNGDPEARQKFLKDFEGENGFSFTEKARFLIAEPDGEGSYSILRDEGHEVLSLSDIKLNKDELQAVWNQCFKEHLVLVTTNLSYFNNREFPLENHRGAIIFSSGQPTHDQLENLVKFFAVGAGCSYQAKLLFKSGNIIEYRYLNEIGLAEREYLTIKSNEYE